MFFQKIQLQENCLSDVYHNSVCVYVWSVCVSMCSIIDLLYGFLCPALLAEATAKELSV